MNGDPPEVPPDASSPRVESGRRRGVIFAAVLGLCIAGAVRYAGHAAWRAKSAAAEAESLPVVRVAALPAAAAGSASALSVPAAPGPPGTARPYLLFRSTALGDQFGKVNLETLDAGGGARLATLLS